MWREDSFRMDFNPCMFWDFQSSFSKCSFYHWIDPKKVMATTADSILLNSGPKSGHRSLTKKRRHSSPLNNCVFEYKTAIQRTSTVLVVRRGSAEVLRSVMQSRNSSSSSNKRTFDILTSSWNQINFDSLAQGLAEISECNEENVSAPSINEEDNPDSKVNLTTFFLLVI